MTGIVGFQRSYISSLGRHGNPEENAFELRLKKEHRQGSDPRQSDSDSGACSFKCSAVLGNWVDIVALIRIENGERSRSI